MAFTAEAGSLGTVKGSTITKYFDTGLTAAGPGPDFQIKVTPAGRKTVILALTARSSSNNTTAQFFSGDPGSGGVAIGEPLGMPTEGGAIGTADFILAQTATAGDLWVQIVGSGTVGMGVYVTEIQT